MEPIIETDKKGNKRIWKIEVEETPEKFGKIITTFGLIDGKQTVQEKIIEKGKNIGKKNETTAYAQALSEAKSLWTKKHDKKETMNVLPMLAHDYNKHSSKIIFPCFVQPKLDGVRMIAKRINNKIKFYSRTGKQLYGLDHIEQEIFNYDLMSTNDIWDGELYSHEMTFDEISGYCRNQKQSKEYKLPQFWVFDTICEFPFKNRMPLFEAYNQNLKYVREVYCQECNDETEIHSFLKEYEQDGYEGIMLRNKESLYETNSRSYGLQKLKNFHDKEFEIVNVLEGKGVDKGTGIFVCKTENNTEFNVKPEGERELRKSYFQNKNNYIGKYLTVKYQELTKTGVPRFPVGISIRDYE